MKKNLRDNPIGIFDSGVGGLTVVKEIIRTLPYEDVIYFGDTARVPYGTKSKESVVKFSGEIVDFLLAKNVKLILVACNTASAVALASIRRRTDVPAVGVIDSGAFAAVNLTKTGKIGIIGTTATITSGAYEKAVRRYYDKIEVVQTACPLFVPLVEEGWIDGGITEAVAREYLMPLKRCGLDVVILGCTHYPLIKDVIGKVLGTEITLVDSATEVSKRVGRMLVEGNMTRSAPGEGTRSFYVSDAPEKFKALGERFLGRSIPKVVKIDIEGK
jgi:glutamate racemase